MSNLNKCKLVPDYSFMRYNHINDNSTNFIFNYGCCGYNNGRNLYSMNCGCGCGGGFWNGALFAIGNFAANIATGFMLMPLFASMSRMMPFGNYQYSTSWLNNSGNYTNGTTSTGKTEVLAKVETEADKAKKEIDKAIKDLGDSPSPDDLAKLLKTLDSKKGVIPKADYDAYLKQIYQIAQEMGYTTLLGPDGNPIDINKALSELDTPAVEDQEIKAFTDLGISAEDAASLKSLGVNVISGAYYNDADSDKKCLSLPTTLNAETLKKVVEIANAKQIKVAVAKNTDSRKDKGQDPWIAGKIDVDTITETGGRIAFTVDCGGVGKNGHKYTFTQTGDTEFKAKDLNTKIEGKKGRYNLANGLLTRGGPPNFS